MPCQGPSPSEVRYAEMLQRAARLLAYVLQKSGQPVSDQLLKMTHPYAWPSYDYTPDLCEAMQRLSARDPAALDALVYDARSPTARDLADWWEEHQRQDQERLLREGSSFSGIELGGLS